MARSFNQVTLMGNLTRDPEVRTTPKGQSVCSFSLALNRSYKGADGNWTEVTDYVDITAVEDRKRAALYAHTSQGPDEMYEFHSAMSRFRGLERGVKHAEAFARHSQSAPIWLP